MNFEQQYLDLLKNILTNGKLTPNRTGTDTLYIVGSMIRHDMSEGFPALTTKRVFIRGGIEEQLFFMRGDTDTKNLSEKGIHYWEGNTSREFLDKRSLSYLPEGNLGCSYSHQYRNYGGNHPHVSQTKGLVGTDQLQNLYNNLLNDPDSRKLIINLWNPVQLPYMALEPCHYDYNFVADKTTKELSLTFKMRSSDTFLGLPINFVMSGFFLQSLAQLIGYKPKELIYFGTNVHLYTNHIDQAKEQLTRVPKNLPVLNIKKDLKTLNDLLNIQWTDIEILGYYPDKSIKATMAI